MRALALASLAALVLPGAVAAAQESTAEARVHFESAVAAYDHGAYEQAEVGFRRAYELSRHPDLLYNVYLAAERSGHLPAAAEALEQYLADGQMSDGRREAFEQRLVRLRARIEATEIGGEVGESSEPTVGNESDELATPVIFVKRSRIHPAATALFVAAGALAVSFAVAAGLSEAEDRSLAGDCGRDTDFPSCADAELEALERRNLVADISWIGAAVLATAGLVVLFTTGGDDEEPQVSASVGLGSLSLRGRF